eukprot:6481466-Amphidinium_carterae.1
MSSSSNLKLPLRGFVQWSTCHGTLPCLWENRSSTLACKINPDLTPRARVMFDVVLPNVCAQLYRVYPTSCRVYASDYQKPVIPQGGEGEQVRFHHCMHGGTRAKHTLLRASPALLGRLAIAGDGIHAYEVWARQSGAWATATEASYPQVLCQKWAGIVLDHVVLKRAALCQVLGRAGHKHFPHP